MYQSDSSHAAGPARELVFIDAGVADPDVLIQGLRPGVQAVVLRGDRPPSAQIAQETRGRSGLDAIHIVAHGRAGEISFDGGSLSCDSLPMHEDGLRAIGHALGGAGSLRLWCCETGADAQGSAFVDALAAATGATVLASRVAIGGGAPWFLDADVQAPVTARAQAAYAGVLGVTLDLDGGGAGTSSTNWVEDTTATLFPSAQVSSDGGDSGLIDEITITLTGWTASMLLALDAAAALVASGAGVTVAYASGELTLTLPFGGNPVSDASWQDMVRGIVFSDSSEEPPAGPISVAGTATRTAFNSGVDAHAITITEVNDAPAGSEGNVDVLEDQVLEFDATDFGFSDLDGDDLLAVQIVTLPGIGALTLNSVAVTAGQYVAAADIAAGLLEYTPLANDHASAYASFQFRVQDDGGTASGGIALAVVANNMVIDVTTVNDAPAGTTGSVQAYEDQAYVFTAMDFGYSDPADGDDFDAVRVATLPVLGALALNGQPVVAGQTIDIDDIDAGKFTFTPATDAFASGYASFTFQVKDDGGTANGGINLDPTPETLTIDVDSRPDAIDVVVSQALVQDTDDGTSLTVEVTYDEEMDVGMAPQIVFSPDLGTTLTPTGGTWDNDGLVFTATYLIDDIGVDADAVAVVVSGGTDLDGNLQDEESFASEFAVDTLNPTVLSVTVNDTTVGPQNVTSPFKVFVTFSEAMDTGFVPTITLSPVINTLDLQPTGGTWSMGGTVYTANYTVFDRAMDIGDITVDVTGTRDLAGNLQQDYTPEVEFDFDTFHFQGDTYANNLVGNNYAHWFLGDNSVDTLKGGTANDTLDGGQWGDSMVGGNGSDVYYVENVNDKVVETNAVAATGGTDLVYASVNFTLGNNVEQLVLTGTANINGKGNTLANDIEGNAGNNLLTGLAGLDTLDGGMGNDSLTGGAGNDSLTGGGGNDTFIFDIALNATTNVDTITDFDANGADKIRLLKSYFPGLATGTLAAGAFVANSAGTASLPGHRIILDTDDGRLLFDRDGSAATYGPVLFARLTGISGTFDNTDIVVTLV